MKRFMVILAAALVCAVACNNDKSAFSKKVADYAVVTIEAQDLSGIADNGKGNVEEALGGSRIRGPLLQDRSQLQG